MTKLAPSTVGVLAAMVVEQGSVTLAVRATPKASKTALGTVMVMPDGRSALSVRVAAPPVDGAANAALIAFFSKRLGVRRSDVTIASGEASRLKLLRISGDGERIAGRIQAMIGDG
ncbi:DUF167 domain-containing protein [Devosia sp.]|uniref:DUF167 domain-containing protein n=1 Tax=Devosia sp. TaxID=1871048 RepID=UPI00262BC451|nr:DUF167 domain-containing protein [Devosia sp.]